jgi:hypothetical protein
VPTIPSVSGSESVSGSIPIPIPTPTPIMIPTAIGTRLSCIEKMSKLQWWAVPTLRVHASCTRTRCPTRMALIKDHLDEKMSKLQGRFANRPYRQPTRLHAIVLGVQAGEVSADRHPIRLAVISLTDSLTLAAISVMSSFLIRNSSMQAALTGSSSNPGPPPKPAWPAI